MFSLRRILRGPEQSVRSLAVQAGDPAPVQQSTVFEILTRHLLDRLVNNEALGEEIPTRVTQLAYTVALPGMLVALYLFAPYHQPHAIGPRPAWLQIADHYFYVTYAFVVMGAVTVFEWDLLFPDLLDVFVLTTLPIPQRRLLLARLLALGIFLGLVLIGTNFLGAFFFPAVADLHRMWWHHLFAHTLAVAAAGGFAAVLFVALQGMLLCVLGRRLFAWVSPIVQALSIVALLAVLFLFPLLASHLKPLLGSGSAVVRFFPPLWFLGLYERLLWGAGALPVFSELAKTGVVATAAVLVLAVGAYPLAYARRTRHLIEGGATRDKRSQVAQVACHVLHRTLLRSPKQRAIFHYISQTLLRTQRLHLYLSIYAGVGVALSLSGILLLRITPGHVGLALSGYGIRTVPPILAFLIAIGLRTSFNAPIGRQGSWLFHVIHGHPLREHLDAAQVWVALFVSTIALATVVSLYLVAPPELRNVPFLLTQLLVAFGLSVLLADIFFLRAHAIPFTETRQPSTKDLPISFVRYFVLFPAFVLYVVDREPWIQASPGHLMATAILLVAAHLMLRIARRRYLEQHDPDAIPADSPIVHRLGLQEY